MSEEMPSERNNDNHRFASIYSVWAMLSRVYLYKGELDSCILYSDKLINSGMFAAGNSGKLSRIFRLCKNRIRKYLAYPLQPDR